MKSDKNETKLREPKKKQCAVKTSAGWGAMKFCMFDEGHDGAHSWVVTG